MITLLRKNHEIFKSGNTSGRVLLLFVISGCMFVLGVLVGRNTAPVHFNMKNLESKLSGLEASVLADDNSKQKQGGKIPEEISFEFYDKLREKSEVDEYAAGRPRVLAPKFEKPGPSELKAMRASAQGKLETRHPPDIKPQRSFKEQEKKYAIQVASLRNPEKAEQVKEKFANKGYPAFTQMAIVEERGKWCRVRLGPYINRKQAEDDLSRLQKAGVDAIIVLND
ncbi:MAG: SPOR domain-containing protein [Desulfobacteraceae bacterium]|nr:SPOR domain-containing protein [Desulfobacteraceae bacterium]